MRHQDMDRLDIYSLHRCHINHVVHVYVYVRYPEIDYWFGYAFPLNVLSKEVTLNETIRIERSRDIRLLDPSIVYQSMCCNLLWYRSMLYQSMCSIDR